LWVIRFRVKANTRINIKNKVLKWVLLARLKPYLKTNINDNTGKIEILPQLHMTYKALL